MNRNYGIYCITNLLNQKKYIGKSNDIQGRLEQHRRELRRNVHCNPHLQHAFNLYGEDVFKFEWLYICEDEDELNRKEKELIDWHNTRDRAFGYNINEGGEGGALSEETKQKMSAAKKGKVRSEEHSKHLAEALRGNSHRKKRKNATSQYWGVTRHPDGNGWQVLTRVNGKMAFIGHFRDELDAAFAYDDYILKHGLDKPLNFRERGDSANSG